MAWNEPGDNKDSDKEKDPWSGRDKKNNDGPPDIDEAIKQLKQRLSAMFGKKNGGQGSGDGSGSKQKSSKGGYAGVIFIVVIAIALWFVSGFYIVQPAQRAAVLRFGKYLETQNPGLHWIPRFIESATKVDVQKIYTYTYPSNEDADMLTKDENIVSVAVTVQYRIDNPEQFLYNVVNPIESLRQATASAMRQVIGLNDLDTILTTGREQIRNEVKQTLEATIQRYQSGIQITDVAIKSAKAPEQVKAAFDDAIKAREDRQRFINQAQAYKMKVEPIAKGQAQRILEAAKAYKQKVVLQAQAATAAYLAILPEYKAAPEVTRERLYLDALENVFKDSNKVLVDVKGSNNLIYLPLDKILGQQSFIKPVKLDNLETNTTTSQTTTAATPTQTVASSRPSRDNPDERYGRGGRY